jgi:DNA-3-methyladenine glycosylase II
VYNHMAMNDFDLKPLPPFRLDLTVWTLRRRAENAVDRWDGHTYRRVLPLPRGPVEIAVRQYGTATAARLRLAVAGRRLSAPLQTAVTEALDRLLGLNVDTTRFHQFARGHPQLDELARRFYGVKPPRFTGMYEALLNAIACQQLTLTFGIGLLNTLAVRYGKRIGTGASAVHAFPQPDALAGAELEELRSLGFSGNKARAIIELARQIVSGELALEALAELPDHAVLARLQALYGVGRWTAEYALLRGLGRTHIFPGDDAGARNNLQRWLNLPEALDYQAVRKVMDTWHGFGGLIYFHLLLRRLAEAGYV